MTLFIAEISSNHNQDLKRTMELIDQAKEIGCWAVKFQLFKAEKLYSPEFKKQIEKMKAWELPERFIKPIKTRCLEQNLKFICTPFDLECIELLKFYDVDYLKIGSYEMLWFPLLKAVINTKIPWIFSTGMTAQMSEIAWPIAMGMDKDNIPYAVLHCNSNYPAKPEHCNLSKIQQIKEVNEKYFSGVKAGWSDHTRNPELVLTAIAQGAEIIEFHFDLEDGKGFESEFGHCWKSWEAQCLIDRTKFHKDTEIKFPGKKEWIYSATNEEEPSKWRTDPEDGLRPLKRFRKELLK